MFPIYDNINELQKGVLQAVTDAGHIAAPRGKRTLELTFVGCTLRSPTNRLLTLQERQWSLPLAIGELCWHASASSDVSCLTYYAKQWAEFSEDGTSITGSCYGRALFGADQEGGSQWTRIRDLLAADPATRRAIVYFNIANDRLSPIARDVACASSMQFLLREDRLQCIVHMRSNDAVWGLPYDVFLFSALQELMALELGAELGHYHHLSGSMHIYERHFDLVKRLLSSKEIESSAMPRMPTADTVSRLAAQERNIRLSGVSPGNVSDNWYLADLSNVLLWHRLQRTRQGDATAVQQQIVHAPYRAILSNLVT